MVSKNYVYTHTTKPPYCKKIHEKENYTLQDLRQMQYNKWSRAKGVYSGNFLPKEEKKAKLLKQGWVYLNPEYNDKPEAKCHANYKCLRNNQYIRECNAEGRFHWHWFNYFKPNGFKEWRRKKKRNDPDIYLNEYGEPDSDHENNHFYR